MSRKDHNTELFKHEITNLFFENTKGELTAITTKEAYKKMLNQNYLDHVKYEKKELNNNTVVPPALIITEQPPKDLTQNKALQDIQFAPIFNRGVKAKEDIKQGTIIGLYAGIYEKKSESYSHAFGKINAKEHGNAMSLINDGAPNLFALSRPVFEEVKKGKKTIKVKKDFDLTFYVALQDIKAGEELYVTYGAPLLRYKKHILPNPNFLKDYLQKHSFKTIANRALSDLKTPALRKLKTETPISQLHTLKPKDFEAIQMAEIFAYIMTSPAAIFYLLLENIVTVNELYEKIPSTAPYTCSNPNLYQEIKRAVQGFATVVKTFDSRLKDAFLERAKRMLYTEDMLDLILALNPLNLEMIIDKFNDTVQEADQDPQYENSEQKETFIKNSLPSIVEDYTNNIIVTRQQGEEELSTASKTHKH